MYFHVTAADRYNLTPFMEQKATWLFQKSLDTDGNGFIEWKDFKLFAEVVVYSLGLTPERGGYFLRTVTERRAPLFKLLLQYCDLDHDGRISLEEFKAFWGAVAHYVRTYEQLPEPALTMATYYYRSLNPSRTGNVKFDNILQAFAMSGGTPEEADTLFMFATQNRRTPFDWRIFQELFKGVFAADDETHFSRLMLIGFT